MYEYYYECIAYAPRDGSLRLRERPEESGVQGDWKMMHERSNIHISLVALDHINIMSFTNHKSRLVPTQEICNLAHSIGMV